MNNTVETIVKMVESLPEALQERVVNELRSVIVEANDEAEWDMQFERKQEGLMNAGRKAKQEIAQGVAEPMDYEKL
ncbi:unnamed protein product [marine sediment metagenome]|uniref:Uncharacterized protein n=1 Tax=marine sediment metagenome TaxID=412755 RepID=X1KGH1_9ZZZZ